MESLLKVVIEPRGPGSETAKERRRKKKKNVLERGLSSSSRYPSMPRYPPSPSHGEIDVSEVRKACFKVRVLHSAGGFSYSLRGSLLKIVRNEVTES